jgi:hypothetical protein
MAKASSTTTICTVLANLSRVVADVEQTSVTIGARMAFKPARLMEGVLVQMRALTFRPETNGRFVYKDLIHQRFLSHGAYPPVTSEQVACALWRANTQEPRIVRWSLHDAANTDPSDVQEALLSFRGDHEQLIKLFAELFGMPQFALLPRLPPPLAATIDAMCDAVEAEGPAFVEHFQTVFDLQAYSFVEFCARKSSASALTACMQRTFPRSTTMFRDPTPFIVGLLREHSHHPADDFAAALEVLLTNAAPGYRVPDNVGLSLLTVSLKTTKFFARTPQCSADLLLEAWRMALNEPRINQCSALLVARRTDLNYAALFRLFSSTAKLNSVALANILNYPMVVERILHDADAAHALYDLLVTACTQGCTKTTRMMLKFGERMLHLHDASVLSRVFCPAIRNNAALCVAVKHARLGPVRILLQHSRNCDFVASALFEGLHDIFKHAFTLSCFASDNPIMARTHWNNSSMTDFHRRIKHWVAVVTELSKYSFRPPVDELKIAMQSAVHPWDKAMRNPLFKSCLESVCADWSRTFRR